MMGLCQRLGSDYSHRKRMVALGILYDETGNVLAFDKFFGSMLPRTGKLVPSENVTRVFLEYARAMSKSAHLISLSRSHDCCTGA